MTKANLVPQCENLSAVSVREQSTSTLKAAIHSPHDPGEVLKRINQVLSSYFDPNLDDPEARAGVREEFCRALAKLPTWAVHRGFDNWQRTRTRRPSPGEIVIEANRAMENIREELKDRAKQEWRQSEDELREAIERVEADRANEIMAKAGFTPRRMAAVQKAPMATSVREAEAAQEKAERQPHWSETAAPDDPRWEELRKARTANSSVYRARAAQ